MIRNSRLKTEARTVVKVRLLFEDSRFRLASSFALGVHFRKTQVEDPQPWGLDE